MARFFLVALALLFFGTAALPTTALAKAEMPMFYDTGSGPHQNLVAARLIQESLNVDPTGNHIISGTPCLTPVILLETIHHDQPDVIVDSVSDLPGLYKSLLPRKAKEVGLVGKVITLSRMVCVKPGTHHRDDHFDPKGWPREVRPEEYVYFLPNHTKPFALGDCWNIPQNDSPPPPPPVVQDVNCLEQDFWGEAGDELHYAVVSPQPFAPDACSPALMQSGESDFHSLINEPCGMWDERHCSFESDAQLLRERRKDPTLRLQSQPTINMVLRKSGFYRIRVPWAAGDRAMRYNFLFCVSRRVGGKVMHSQTAVLTALAFRKGRAYIAFEPSKAWQRPPADWPGLLHEVEWNK